MRTLILALLVGLSSAAWAQLRQTNLRVDNLLEALERLPDSAEVLHFDPRGQTFPPGGHFQGIQYVGPPFDKAYISASSDTLAYAFAVDMGSAHLSDFYSLTQAPLRHAGGFQVCGEVLAMGIEDNRERTVSEVHLYDMRGAMQTPVATLHRQGVYERATAGAVALAQVGKRHLLIVGTWDCATLDVYWSNGLSLDAPELQFVQTQVWWRDSVNRTGWVDPHFGSYQNLNLVVQTDGQVMLAGFCQEGARQYADVFSLEIRDDRITLRKVYRKALPFRIATVQAGGGLTVLSADAVGVYACHHRDAVVEWLQP